MLKVVKIKEMPKKSKHTLWNCGESGDNFDSRDRPFTRFYFAIVDNRSAYRELTRSRLFNILSEQNSGVIQIGRDVEFSVKGSEWGLLFVVYDAMRNLQDLKFADRRINAKQDFNFKEKKVIEIEDYLRTRYE
jgi:hypothetical protein